MNKEEYIEIKEAETITGISSQYIYRLEKKEEYKQYYKRINRKLHVSKDFIVNHFSNKEEFEDDNIYIKEKKSTAENNYNDKLIEILEKQIEDLQNQLVYQEKRAAEEITFLREQIESKYKQLESKDKQLDQQQQLNAMTLSQMKELSAPKEEPEKKPGEEKKKSFWEKLMG